MARSVSSIDIKQMAEQLKRDWNGFIIDTKVTQTLILTCCFLCDHITA